MEAFIWRITSTPNRAPGTIELGIYNPSYPEIGKLLNLDRFPTEEEILKGYRMMKENGEWGTRGDAMYCTLKDGVTPCKDYGWKMQKVIQTVKNDFTQFLKDKILCYKNEMEVLKEEREKYLKQVLNKYLPQSKDVSIPDNIPSGWDPFTSKILEIENEIIEMEKLQSNIEGL